MIRKPHNGAFDGRRQNGFIGNPQIALVANSSGGGAHGIAA